MEGISLGHTTFTQLENFTGLESGFLLRLLNTLSNEYQIVKKEKPLFPNNRKITKYSCTNNFIYFWFKYVFSFQSILELDHTSGVLDKISKEQNTLLGFAYENLCKEYIFDVASRSHPGRSGSNKHGKEALEVLKHENILEIGKWWDKSGEIDIILRTDNNTVLLVECKLAVQQITDKSITSFIKTANRIDAIKSKNKKLLFFTAEECPAETKRLLDKNNIGVVEVHANSLATY